MIAPAALRGRNPPQTSYMRYRAAQTGSELEDLDARWMPLQAISPLLIGAVVLAEDPRFFAHHGADVSALARKFVAAARGRMSLVGASTLTQQLARNLYLTPTRSIWRKLRELELALRLEATLSKARILELYLNVIEWGGGVWGCEAACSTHLGKRVDALDLFDATFLVSLIPAPRALFAGRNAARSRYAQLRVAYQMLLAGLVSAAECSAATQRIRHMHARLAEGGTPGQVLAGSTALPADIREIASMDALCQALGVRRLATPTAAEALALRCGADQERRTWRVLHHGIGLDALSRIVHTGDYRPLQEFLAHCGATVPRERQDPTH
jgi:monofunctional glycosyltransferase